MTNEEITVEMSTRNARVLHLMIDRLVANPYDVRNRASDIGLADELISEGVDENAAYDQAGEIVEREMYDLRELFAELLAEVGIEVDNTDWR